MKQNGSHLKERQSIDKFREDLRRMDAQVRQLQRQLADAVNGKLPEDARLDPEMIRVSSLVSASGHEPLIMLRWFTSVAQLTPDQARSLAFSLLDVAEAAKSDAFLMRFMAPTNLEAGAQLVAAFREFRQHQGGN